MDVIQEVVIDRRSGGRTPGVSVIMPVFNIADYVEEAVQSILHQSFENLECIVVDDGSTDETLRIVRAIDDGRLVVLHQENCGYPIAMNFGLRHARALLIARMDGDDLSLSRRLEKQKAFLDEHPEFGLVGTRWSYLTPRGRVHSEQLGGEGLWSEVSWDAVYRGRKGFADPSAMFRAQVVTEVGGYRTYQRSGQDIDLWLRIMERGWKSAVLHDPLYQLRITIGAISDNPATAARNRVPRLLADERKTTGSDRAMRGEHVDSLLTEEVLSSYSIWHEKDLWRKAAVCFSAGDALSAIRFSTRAIRAGGFSRETVRGMLQTLLHGVRTSVARMRHPMEGRLGADPK